MANRRLLISILLCTTTAIICRRAESLAPPWPPRSPMTTPPESPSSRRQSSSSSWPPGTGRREAKSGGGVATYDRPFARRRHVVFGPTPSSLSLSRGDDDDDGADRSDADATTTATTTTTTSELDVDGHISSWSRLVASLPGRGRGGRPDELDARIMSVAVPSMLNLMVVPLVNAVDTLYVGRLADPLALAAQSAANQCFFSIYFMAAFLPTITAPLVARAIGKQDWDGARDRVCEGLFLSNVLGGAFSLLLMGFPRAVLRLVLPPGAAPGVMDYAVPYLRWRAVGMVPALFASTGFAAYRGLLNTVTPLKVSLTTNLLNLALDPLFIFGMGRGGAAAAAAATTGGASFLSGGLGPSGAAAATSIAEMASALIYLRLLVRRRLVQWSRLFRPPKLESLLPLIQGGLAMLMRQLTLNVAFVSAARRAQVLDPTGVSAAAYGITMQIYSLGVVCHLGIQGTAAALVPSARAAGGDDAAREVADRIFAWGTCLGVVLAVAQWFALPAITPLFTPLAEVRDAVRGPAMISSFIHLVNGLVFAGEGTMLGLGCFRDLALITALGVAAMVSCLSSPLGSTLNGVLVSLAAFNLVQGLAVTLHHVRVSPLRRRGFFKPRNAVV